MKSLVANEIIKQISDNGTELKLGSSQVKRDCEYITKKDIVVSGVKIAINKDTFISAVGGTLSRESYIFRYKNGNNTGWSLDDVGTVNLADYGITFDGTLNKGDMIYVYCDTVNNKITSYKYSQYIVVYEGSQYEYFNYANITCDNSQMSFALTHNPNYNISLIGEITTKAELFFKSNYQHLTIVASYDGGYYEQATINIVVAKVV